MSAISIVPPMSSKAPRTVTRTNGPAGTSSVTLPAPPPTSNVWFTAAERVFRTIDTLLAETVMPGTWKATVPGCVPPTSNDAAIPPASIIRAPVPPLMSTNGLPCGPSVRDRFVAATLTTVKALGPVPVVVWRNVKLPPSVCPATVRVAPVPLTATDDMPGVVSTATVNMPPRETLGMFAVTVAAKVPMRTPEALTVRWAVPPLAMMRGVEPSPRLRATSVASTDTAPVMSLAKLKFPERDWPRMLTTTFSPPNRLTPAATSSVLVIPPTVNWRETRPDRVFCSKPSVPWIVTFGMPTRAAVPLAAKA